MRLACKTPPPHTHTPPAPIPPSVMLKTSRYLPTGYVQSQEWKNQLCAAVVCVCARLWPLFHLHVWCSRVAAGETGEVGGEGGVAYEGERRGLAVPFFCRAARATQAALDS